MVHNNLFNNLFNNLLKNIEFFDLTTEDIENKEVVEINFFPYLLIFSIELSDKGEITYSDFIFHITDDERKKGYAYNEFDTKELLDFAKELNKYIPPSYDLNNLYELRERPLGMVDKDVLKTIFVITLYIMISKFVQNRTGKYREDFNSIPKVVYKEYLYLVSLDIMGGLDKYDLD